MRLSSLITRGPADVIAPFRGVADGVAHVSQSAAVDQIHNQLELVQHFEVGALGLIAGFDQRFVSRLDQRAHAAAKHRLLAEEIGLGLFFERGFEHTCPRAADALQIAEAQSMRVARRILVDGDQARYAAALGEDLAHPMARGLGRGHPHVDTSEGNDGLEVNIEAVREHAATCPR